MHFKFEFFFFFLIHLELKWQIRSYTAVFPSKTIPNSRPQWAKCIYYLFSDKKGTKTILLRAAAHDTCMTYIIGLSLRAGGRGFSPATKRVAPGYFYWKIEEKKNQKKSLAIWFTAYLLYLPGNLKSQWHATLIIMRGYPPGTPFIYLLLTK